MGSMLEVTASDTKRAILKRGNYQLFVLPRGELLSLDFELLSVTQGL
jgi:hypothetical protein